MTRSKTSYFFLHPFKPQFFFPKEFQGDDVFLSFFQPYTLVGEISWFLFRHLFWYRLALKKKSIENYLPEQKIRKIIASNDLMAFNRGTAGLDQKITALGKRDNAYFFIKYAESPRAIKNVSNEHFILKQLSKLNFVPKPQKLYTDKNHVLLQTEAIVGKRVQTLDMNEKILVILIKIAAQNVDGKTYGSANQTQVFAHGDFCPWNLMISKGNYHVYDWEMAGIYPLGFDLFTFLFQPSFLLNPKKSISEILDQNRSYISQFFEHFEETNWKKYLVLFAKTKINIETHKKNKNLYVCYSKLLKHAKGI